MDSLAHDKSDRIFHIVNNAVLGVFLLIVLYPLLYVVSASFSSASAVISGKVWLWPVEFSLDGYAAVFRHRMVWSGLQNTPSYIRRHLDQRVGHRAGGLSAVPERLQGDEASRCCSSSR